MTTTTALDLADCRRARNRYLVALRLKRKSHAIKLLVSGYLPALRDLAVSTDPEHIRDAIETLAGRLDKGMDYNGGEELFEELLNDYIILLDCSNLNHEAGSRLHPAIYLMDRIETACR